MAIPIWYDVNSSPAATTLGEDVQQIVKQKKAFHTITEEGLFDGLRDGQDDIADFSTTDDEDVETVQATKDRLFSTKAEFQQQLNKVQLDLLALIDALALVTSATSRLGHNAMSPALRTAVPKGTGTLKIVAAKSKLPQSQVSKLADVSYTYRTQRLDAASQSIMRAASRLELEAQHQAKYWQGLAGLKAKGWSISRRPNDNRALVVHCSPVDSAPQYRAKGTIGLGQDEDGDLRILSHAQSQNQRSLNVTVRRKGRTTGRHESIKHVIGTSSKAEQNLLHLRDALAQEELFTEATKEARLISNLGVRHRGMSIQMEISKDCIVAISLEKQKPDQRHLPDDDLASAISQGLHLMLLTEHRQRHMRRARNRPLPLSSQPRPDLEYVLLRPMLAHLRHSNFTASMTHHLDVLEAALLKAGFSLGLVAKSVTTSQRAMESFKGKLETRLEISLPTGSMAYLRVETYLAGPLYGTRFTATKYQNQCGSTTLVPSPTIRAAIDFVNDVVAREIGCMLINETSGTSLWQVKVESPLQLGLTRNGLVEMMVHILCDDSHLRIRAQTRDQRDYRAEWTTQGVTLAGTGGNRTSDATLIELLESWQQQS